MCGGQAHFRDKNALVLDQTTENFQEMLYLATYNKSKLNKTGMDRCIFADSDGPHMSQGKILPWKVMKKLF